MIVCEQSQAFPKWYRNSARESLTSGTGFGALPGKQPRTARFRPKSSDAIVKSLNIWERALSAAEVTKLYSYGQRSQHIPEHLRFPLFGTEPL